MFAWIFVVILSGCLFTSVFIQISVIPLYPPLALFLNDVLETFNERNIFFRKNRKIIFLQFSLSFFPFKIWHRKLALLSNFKKLKLKKAMCPLDDFNPKQYPPINLKSCCKKIQKIDNWVYIFYLFSFYRRNTIKLRKLTTDFLANPQNHLKGSFFSMSAFGFFSHTSTAFEKHSLKQFSKIQKYTNFVFFSQNFFNFEQSFQRC